MPGKSDSVRPFPLPWTIHGNDSCYWVEDADEKRFGFCYFDERPGGRATGDKPRLTRAEALRIVRNIGKLPELTRR